MATTWEGHDFSRAEKAANNNFAAERCSAWTGRKLFWRDCRLGTWRGSRRSTWGTDTIPSRSRGLSGGATTELEAWRRRSLQGQRYKFLYIDGANFLVRINGHVSRQSFCAVLGVSEENERFEVLALEMGDRERADLWASLFEDLAERGLNLETVELGIMDGLPGLEAIFQRFFPRAQTQRCQKHAKANACRRVRKQERELFSKDLNAIFYAPTQSAARAAFFTLKQQWGRLFPSAVQIIEKDLDSLLTFFQFDPTYWTVLRTTNSIERLNKEFKRRTRAMEVTGGEISTYRCLAYVAQTMEYRWSFHPLSQWSTVYTLNAA